MSSPSDTRRRLNATPFVVECTFARDCACSRKGYTKTGWLKTHLERFHSHALGLQVGVPTCSDCRKRFASTPHLVDHIIKNHTRARTSPSSPSTAPARTSSAGSSPSIHSLNNWRIGFHGPVMAIQQTSADVVDGRQTFNEGASRLWDGEPPNSAIQGLNTPMPMLYAPPTGIHGYIHTPGPEFLPQPQARRDTEIEFPGFVDRHVQSGQPGQPPQGWMGRQ